MNRIKFISYSETLVEISMAVALKYQQLHDVVEDSRIIVNECISWAEQFEKLHKHTDWDAVDFIDTVEQFADEKINQFISPVLNAQK